MSKFRNLLLVLSVIIFYACQTRNEIKLFKLLKPDQTGIDFVNKLQSTTTNNILEYDYFYDGSGVAAADFDNDGFTDLYFAGNQVSGRLYRNTGGDVNGTLFKFEDITISAGVQTNGWTTGVAVADVNNDGWQDLYICHAGLEKSANNLFINLGKQADGTIRFEDQAVEAGVDFKGFSTQAAFIDYDKDGNVDLYLLNHFQDKMNPNYPKIKKLDGSGSSNDKLYRNNGQGKFTDVTIKAGITSEGYGLGINISDLNSDGWPDIYVANDFVYDDLIFINNQDGTFSERARDYFRHTSYSSMGCDIADFNNDFFPDILTLDMKPEDSKREKLMAIGINNYSSNLSLQNGYIPQYPRNVLQLNNGDGSFSEIGQLAGISRTDWSWSALFADLDNDGWKDIYITNGIPKDITNNDFVRYRYLETKSENIDYEEVRNRLLKLIELMEPVDKPNFAFSNRADGFTFKDKSELWSLNDKGFSNGAVYADLDNDGDLDLVTNNLNAPAFVYQNNSRQLTGNNYLRIKLTGPQVLGSKVRISSGQIEQFAEYSPYRGFQSSQEQFLHFGIGKSDLVDTVDIIWPDGKFLRLLAQNVNQVLSIDRKDATSHTDDYSFEKISGSRVKGLFSTQNTFDVIPYRHEENQFDDFNIDPLLPYRFSQNGPFLAKGDINNDGLEDVWIGGPAKFTGKLFFQQKNGSFVTKEMPDPGFEDQEGLFLDVDKDGDLDLFVVSGGNEYNPFTAAYQDRLYINDGKGNFTRRKESVPVEYSSGKCVKAADFDQDGDLDLFVGGRVVPNQYPRTPESFLFINDGKGNFKNGTNEFATGLQYVGMVTDAVWSDTDKDGWMDLILVGEYMGITVFHNNKGFLSQSYKSPQTGLWMSIEAGDFNNDGYEDFVVGNLGLNSNLNVSEQSPVSVSSILSGNKIFPIVSFYNSGREYTTAGYDQLVVNFPLLKKKFRTFEEFSKAQFIDIFSKDEIENKLSANYLNSIYLKNIDGHTFEFIPLPLAAQIAPLTDFWIGDLNGDKNLDILSIGNNFSPDFLTGRHDALCGLLLTGDGIGGFNALKPNQSGLHLRGDMKSLIELNIAGNQTWLVGTNSSALQAVTLSEISINKSLIK